MTERDLDQFKLRLLEERKAVVARVLQTMRQDTTLDCSDLPDELDLASAESTQGMVLRLRDREGFYLRKIDEALRKIEAGVFGICEACEEQIPLARLKVRPVAPLCIRCKETQEMLERSYAF